MSNTKKFSQKALVLHTAAALFAMSAHAAPYQQGSSAIATVDAGERVEKNHRHHRREKARRLHQQKTLRVGRADGVSVYFGWINAANSSV